MAINTKNLVKTVATLTKSLSPRNKDIISRRFGLKSGKKETLESIGKSYGITRERVRQIEEFSINQLSKNIAGESSVNGVVLAAKDFIATHKGVVKEADLFKALTGNDKENIANASLHFILTLSGEPVRFGENDAYHTFWALDKNHAENYKGSIATLVKTLSKHGELVHHDKFLDFAVTSGVATPTGENLSHDNFQAMLAVSKEIGKNVFNQVGLTKWSEVKPKGVRDKAYLVLKREKEPLHFSDIAKAINAIGFSNKKANIQTVHNELIKDSRFVLVGRGMYGLSEWGYKPGTVKDVLVDVLRTSSKPLSKDELVKKVMGARMVKENTIILNLQDSRTFIRKEDGTYSLKK
jgi:hypothetical protein